MNLRADQTIIDPEIDVEFTEEQHDIWGTLYARQAPQIHKYVGADNLRLPSDRIPSIQWLNGKITPLTSWKTIRTRVRYSDAVRWYDHFSKKEFLITDYFRNRSELDFTPEPDMFHDVFGHLPYFTLSCYVEIHEMFAPAFHKSQTAEQRENIKRLAWFSTEFGLIRQKGELKIFGTGLISSKGEMEYVLAGNTPMLPFNVSTIINFDKATWSYNDQLFVFDSPDELKQELAGYFDTL